MHRFRCTTARATALAWGLAHAVSVAAAEFVSGIEDLPLMPGLSEVRDGRVVFEVADGRIVQAKATGAVSRREVAGFYAETLPQLGWCAGENGVFHREGERLILEFDGSDRTDLGVRFTLEPAPGGRCP